MSWVAVGVTAASMAAGAMKGASDKKKYRRQQKAEAVKTAWSPWTGQMGQTLAEPSGAVSKGFAGGVQGLSMGMGLRNAGFGQGKTIDPTGGGGGAVAPISTNQSNYSKWGNTLQR